MSTGKQNQVDISGFGNAYLDKCKEMSESKRACASRRVGKKKTSDFKNCW